MITLKKNQAYITENPSITIHIDDIRSCSEEGCKIITTIFTRHSGRALEVSKLQTIKYKNIQHWKEYSDGIFWEEISSKT